MKRKKACRLVEKNLMAIAENNLEKEILSQIRGHLEVCARCAGLSQRFARAWKNIDLHEEQTLSPASLANLMKKAAAYDQKPSHWRDVFVLLRRYLRPAVAALLLIAGIFIGHELGNISINKARSDGSFASQLIAGLEDIPRGSVADFYAVRQILEKEKTK